jgi:hypothetical protein
MPWTVERTGAVPYRTVALNVDAAPGTTRRHRAGDPNQGPGPLSVLPDVYKPGVSDDRQTRPQVGDDMEGDIR